MNVLGMGPAELLLVLALALVVFGPDKLPDLARQIGRVVGELRRVSSDVTREVQRSIQDEQPSSGPRIVRQSPPSGPLPVRPASSPTDVAGGDAEKQPGESPAPANTILPPARDGAAAPAPATERSWESAATKPSAPDAGSEPRRTA